MTLLLWTSTLWLTVCYVGYYRFLLGEEAQASPSIANTLWRVWTMFTRSAITPPEVNGFGWNLRTPRLLIAAVPDKFWARSAQKRQRESEPKFCFFYPLNNARFHRLPVGQISRNLHKKTCFRIRCWGFGKHLWKFARKGSFPKKTPFWLDQCQRFPTCGLDFSETITNLGKSWQVGTPVALISETAGVRGLKFLQQILLIESCR